MITLLVRDRVVFSPLICVTNRNKIILHVLIVMPQRGLMKNGKTILEPFTYLKQTRGKFMGYVLIQIA